MRARIGNNMYRTDTQTMEYTAETDRQSPCGCHFLMSLNRLNDDELSFLVSRRPAGVGI